MLYLNTILDLIFPVNCICCGQNGQYICFECLSRSKNAVRECPDWIFPLYDYRHPPVKKAVWLLKYKSKRQIAKIFAEVLYERILEESEDLKYMENFQKPIIIPIPLSKKRLKERGYNQSELMAREMLKIDKERSGIFQSLETGVLVKIRDTEHQARIKDRKHRLETPKGSFAVIESDQIKGQNVILIDDVVTTGATLSEAKRTLKKAGARKIYAFTLAH